MKKTVCLILSVILCLLTCAVYAEQAQEPAPILFRNVPWGSNMPDTYAILEGFTFSSPNQDYAGDVDDNVLEDGEIRFKDYVSAKVYARSLKDVKVAGYELSGLNLHFAYTTDESGLLPKDEEHTALVFASYTINPKDLEFVMNDLVGKLTKTYGEPSGHRTTGRSITYDIYYWLGGEGTIVSLVGESYSSGSTNVYIRYSFYGADDLYQKAIDALVYEEMLKTDTEDTSGL